MIKEKPLGIFLDSHIFLVNPIQESFHEYLPLKSHHFLSVPVSNEPEGFSPYPEWLLALSLPQRLNTKLFV